MIEGRDRQPPTARDLALLTDLARPAGAAVHAAGLADALRASQRRLVQAREEERRRLRRDLHDGLGPTLAGVVLGLDAAAGAGRGRSRRGAAAAGRAQGARRAAPSTTSAGWCTTCARRRSTSSACSAPCGSRPNGCRCATTAWTSDVDAAGAAAPARRGHRGRRLPDRARGGHQRRPARPAPGTARVLLAADGQLRVEVTDDGDGHRRRHPARCRPGRHAGARDRGRRAVHGVARRRRRHAGARPAPAGPAMTAGPSR